MSRVTSIIESVEGGVARSIDELLYEQELTMEMLTPQELCELNEGIFECENCGWTIPEEDRAEDADGDICQECKDDE